MQKDVEQIARDLGIALGERELALIGLGAVLKGRPELLKPVVTVSAGEVSIKAVQKLGRSNSVYPEVDSEEAEAWTVIVNGQERKFFVFRSLLDRPTGKPDDYYGLGWLVVKGKLSNGVYKAKDFPFEGGKRIVLAWGATKERPGRHKFNEQEAHRAAAALGREIYYNEAYKCWYIVLENDAEDLIKAWLVLWGEM
jgi:hypothetical protein